MLSVAGISCDLAGALLFRELVGRILNQTSTVFVWAQRPFFDVTISRGAIAGIADQIEHFTCEGDSFRLSFMFDVKADNAAFSDVLLRIWREYEQPFICFYKSPVPAESCTSLLREKDQRWSVTLEKISSISDCYSLFRSVEDEVVWIDKSDSLRFEDVGLLLS